MSRGVVLDAGGTVRDCGPPGLAVPQEGDQAMPESKRRPKAATVGDVAAMAAVSTATVSRVLNGKTVRPDMAEAVLLAAERLNYSFNRTARALRRNLGDVIALILPDIENPFFTSIARGVEDIAQEYGYSVILCNSDDDDTKEAKYVRIAVSENSAGIIISPAGETGSLGPALEAHMAVVVVDRPVPQDLDHVVLDNVEITRRAVASLRLRGWKRIACVTGLPWTPTARTRAEAWREELESAGLPAPDELLKYANFHVAGGRTATEELLLLPEPPDAILATNNLVGVGVLQVLAERGISVQEFGVGVVGDLPFATSRRSDIALIELYPREMGILAAQMLMERLSGNVTGPGRRVVFTRDVRRTQEQ